MRLLHPGISHDDPRILARASQPNRGRHPESAGRSSLPVHRLSGYCGGGIRRGDEAEDGNTGTRERGNAAMKTRPLRQARSVSRRIGDYLRQPRAGYILATFDRSCYLDMDGQIVALVAPALLNGPLNLMVEMDAWQERVTPGAVAVSTAHALRIDGGLDIGLHEAAVWDATLQAWPEEQVPMLRAHLPTLQRLLDREAPEGGLARAVSHPNASTTALERRAAPAGGEPGPGRPPRGALPGSRAAGGLAGPGPGVGPSGGDVLLGGLLAFCLHADGSRALRQ